MSSTHQRHHELQPAQVNQPGPLIEDCSGPNLDEDALRAIDLARPEPVPASLAAAPSPVAPKGADLSHADLQGADLSHADLSFANLSRANLAQARLDRANLAHADLRGTDLRSAHLAAARLEDAKLYGAIFNQWTDLPFEKEEAVRKGMVYLEISTEN